MATYSAKSEKGRVLIHLCKAFCEDIACACLGNKCGILGWHWKEGLWIWIGCKYSIYLNQNTGIQAVVEGGGRKGEKTFRNLSYRCLILLLPLSAGVLLLKLKSGLGCKLIVSFLSLYFTHISAKHVDFNWDCLLYWPYMDFKYLLESGLKNHYYLVIYHICKMYNNVDFYA